MLSRSLSETLAARAQCDPDVHARALRTGRGRSRLPLQSKGVNDCDPAGGEQKLQFAKNATSFEQLRDLVRQVDEAQWDAVAAAIEAQA